MGGKKVEPLAVVHRDCAGIDVGKRKHYVAVDPSQFEEPVRNFGTFTQDLESMAEWLSSCGVREVAMESTGVYWIPAFEVLDRAGFQVHLVNPRATKQVSGRKSDVLDCQWIWQLMSYGLLRGAFRAPDALCPMRSYVRQRGQLIRDRSRAVQHMQKALTQMNVQLDNVLSDLMGKTGQLIVRALVGGERDGAVLARFRDGRCKADAATLSASLQGNWRDEHLFALEQALARHDMLQGQIEACEARIDAELDEHALHAAVDEPPSARTARDKALRQRLHRMLGADLTAIPTIGVETALTFAAEIGGDLSRFPSARHERSRPPPINWPGWSTPCSLVAKRMSSRIWRRWRPNGAIARSSTFSAKPDTSTSPWCRPNKRRESESFTRSCGLFHARRRWTPE